MSINSLGNTAASAVLNLGGNTLTVSSGLVYNASTAQTISNGILDFGSAEAIFNGNFDSISARITGTGGLTIGNTNTSANAGTRISNNTNTFTGGVRVQEGYFRTSGSEVIPDSNNVFVSRYGIFQISTTNTKETIAGLSGTGRAEIVAGVPTSSIILGNTIVSPSGNSITLNTNGVIAPGNQSGGSDILPGQLTLATSDSTGSVILQDGDINLNINSLSQFDSLSLLASTVTLSNGSFLGSELALTLGYAPTLGDLFLIVANDGVDAITGSFVNGNTLTASFNSVTYQFNILYNSSLGGGTGNDIVLQAAAIVPEPASVTLLGIGLLGGAIWLRRRKA